MATMQHKSFYVREFTKTESATAVQRAFRLRFKTQPPTGKSICRWDQFTSYLSLVIILIFFFPFFTPMPPHVLLWTSWSSLLGMAEA